MFTVTKHISFCYGHRLMNYSGACGHPHGHNANVEVVAAVDVLDEQNMVMDFSYIKTVAKSWIDEKLDHKMILRHDDPLTKFLQDSNEPVFVVDKNPTAEYISKLIYDHLVSKDVRVLSVRVWETPTSVAEYIGGV